jgi:hypothetical protein
MSAANTTLEPTSELPLETCMVRNLESFGAGAVPLGLQSASSFQLLGQISCFQPVVCDILVLLTTVTGVSIRIVKWFRHDKSHNVGRWNCAERRANTRGLSLMMPQQKTDECRSEAEAYPGPLVYSGQPRATFIEQMFSTRSQCSQIFI